VSKKGGEGRGHGSKTPLRKGKIVGGQAKGQKGQATTGRAVLNKESQGDGITKRKSREKIGIFTGYNPESKEKGMQGEVRMDGRLKPVRNVGARVVPM